MKYKFKNRVHFVIDPRLIQDERTEFLVRALLEEKIKYTGDVRDDDNGLFIIFAHKKNLRQWSRIKNRIIVLDSNEEDSGPFVEKVNFNSLTEITQFIDKVFLIVRRSFLENKIKESERQFEKIKALNAKESDSAMVLTLEDQKDLEGLFELELSLLKDEHHQDWNAQFKVFTKKNSQVQHLALLDGNKLLEEDMAFDDGTLILALPLEQLYLLLRFRSQEREDYAKSAELIVTMILRTIQLQDQKLVKSDGEIDFWKKIFAKIPYPMAVISGLGDLLIYNESFAKIGILPKECLRFKDQESLELYQNFYKVRRLEFPINLMEVSYFIFYTSENKSKDEDKKSPSATGSIKGGVNELGIISSSIAHELNNPLGGILAALSVLSLEDDWTNEELNDLQDMKNGAKRCKELVEIFLGFSKFSPATAQVASIKTSLDQAINLTRFRMVESNLRLEIKYTSTLELFSHQINSSIMSMILYLILNELMTAFAHERLIKHSSLPVMSGEVLEFSNQIILKLDSDFEYEEKLAQSKLIQHLLVFEKLEINFLRKEIRLIYRA